MGGLSGKVLVAALKGFFKVLFVHYIRCWHNSNYPIIHSTLRFYGWSKWFVATISGTQISRGAKWTHFTSLYLLGYQFLQAVLHAYLIRAFSSVVKLWKAFIKTDRKMFQVFVSFCTAAALFSFFSFKKHGPKKFPKHFQYTVWYKLLRWSVNSKWCFAK